MDRRDFIRMGALAGASLLLPTAAFARISCSDLGPFMPSMRCVAELAPPFPHVNIPSSVAHRYRWCWAACIEMIFRYGRHPVSRQRIVREAWGQIADMPTQPAQILAALKRTWQDDKGVAFTVSSEDVVSADVAMQRLSINRPLIVGTGGHVMVMTGLTYLQRGDGPVEPQTEIVQDPWPGRGKRMLSAGEWKHRDFLVELHTADADAGGMGVLNG